MLGDLPCPQIFPSQGKVLLGPQLMLGFILVQWLLLPSWKKTGKLKGRTRGFLKSFNLEMICLGQTLARHKSVHIRFSQIWLRLQSLQSCVAITTVLGDPDYRTFSSSQYILSDCTVLEQGLKIVSSPLSLLIDWQWLSGGLCKEDSEATSK